MVVSKEVTVSLEGKTVLLYNISLYRYKNNFLVLRAIFYITSFDLKWN